MIRKEFERVSPESVGISSKTMSKFIDAIDSGYGEIHGIMVMRHGKICGEGWWAPYAPGMHHMCASLTKTYMGTAIGIAIKDGLLGLDDKLIDIFPEFKPENPSEYIEELTVRTVLCMGTGMEVFPSMEGNWVKNYIAVPLVHKPMTDFHYNSVGSTFLGKIIEKLTGKDVFTYLSEKLFPIIGIDPDNIDHGIAPEGQDMWAWRTVSTTEDNLRLMKLYANGGMWENERLLTEEFVKLATTSQIDNTKEMAANHGHEDAGAGYGFQMWMCKYPGAYRADGARGQYSVVIPDKDMIISIFEDTEDPFLTLENIWDVLIPEVKDEVLPEDNAAYESLLRKLRRLTIDNPRHNPYSDIMGKVSGKYLVKSGTFHPYCVGMFAPEPDLPLYFEISFGNMEGKIHWVATDRTECTLEFATDGSRRYNRFPSPWQFATISYANGYWEGNNDFVLEVLWPENNSRRKFTFSFEKDKVIVRNQKGGLPGQKKVIEETVAVRKG